MTVYIEYVIIDNVIIDYLMLKASLTLTGTPCKNWRLFLCALLGAGIALLYPLLEVIKPIMIAVKILSGFLIVLLSTKFYNFKSYYINTALFFTFIFLTGGAIMGIFSIFNIDYTSEFSVAIMALPVYAVIKFLSGGLKFLYRRKDKVNNFYNVEYSLLGRNIKAKGFMDTGNGVYDGDRIVVFVDRTFFINGIGKEIHRLKFKKINLKTVNGESQKIAVEVDQFKIYIDGQVNIHNNVTLCVVGDSSCECPLILHPALMEVVNNAECSVEIKKIS